MQVRPDSLFAKHAQQVADRSMARRSGDASSSTANEFLHWIQEGVGKVNSMQNTANLQVEQMLAGEDIQSSEVLTGLQKADMAFRLLVQVRNKLMDAYEEINSIRV